MPATLPNLQFIAAVYVPPDANANANATLKELHDAVSSFQNKHPEALYMTAGDFSHLNLQDTLPMLNQHVTVPTRGDNTLDRVYTNIRETHRAALRLHLDSSDHISIMLVPAYCPVVKIKRARQKTITVWPTEAVSMLQDCFETTEWQMFKEAATEGDTVNLEQYTKSVLGYIDKCVEDVTIIKTIAIPPNQKQRHSELLDGA